jgi:hypothetical protein
MNSSFQSGFDMHQKYFNGDVHNLYFFNENHFELELAPIESF